MKNHPKNYSTNNPTNPQTNRPQANQPAHCPENNLINRYLNRITKNNHSIILYDKETNQNDKSFWKLFYKQPYNPPNNRPTHPQPNHLKHYLDRINLPIKITQLSMQSK